MPVGLLTTAGVLVLKESKLLECGCSQGASFTSDCWSAGAQQEQALALDRVEHKTR
jgi:hypothetical protein